MNQSTFFCDHCYKEDHNEIKTFFNRYSKTDYTRHIKTKKHLKQCLKVENDENKILCKECNNYFSREGYEVHRKRNQSMWDMNEWTKKELKLKCNNIVIDGKRFCSINHWSKWLDLEENKVPQKRKSKKSIHSTSNNYTLTHDPPSYTESESEIEESEKEESDKEEVEVIEEEVESDYDENCGEKPIFAELCDDCGLPQNDECYSNHHLSKWPDIDICGCQSEDENDIVMNIKVI
tara:strand:+ start:94 stop:798 length:705 start_codon:yes stop_codon:yes gene_type:complete